MEREQLIQKINEHYDDLKKELEDYKSVCLENIRNSDLNRLFRDIKRKLDESNYEYDERYEK